MKYLWLLHLTAGRTGIVRNNPKTLQQGCSVAQSMRFSSSRGASSARELLPQAEVSDVALVSLTGKDLHCWRRALLLRGKTKRGGGNGSNAEQKNEILLWEARCASQESTLMG